jgi:hypothetical protein
MRLLSIALALFPVPFFGCGKGNDTLNNQNSVMNTKPLGYVAGQVTNGVTSLPVMGASVQLTGGGLTNQATTDDKGAFSFGPIAAGAMFALHVTADGMVDAMIPSLQIADAAGNFPTENGALYVGPIALLPSTGKFSVQVVSQAGSPVPKANVTIETLVRYVLGGAAKDTAIGTSMTDTDGLASVANLPDVRALPPHLADASGIVISVAPVDLSGNGTAALRGATVVISGADVRTGANIPVVVLPYAGDVALSVIASNVQKLVGPTTAPSVLAKTDPIRIVYSKPIDHDSVAVDLRDETGTMMVSSMFVTGTIGNLLTITPMNGLVPGTEYNLAVRANASSTSRPETLTVAAPFFAKTDPNTMIVVSGRFHDVNGDGQWGNDGDQIELSSTLPIGRAGLSPAFVGQLWVALDLNGNNIIGDGPGELPGTNAPYPTPIVVQAAEPAPGNGAGLSGFTRFFAPVPIALQTVRGAASGPVNFEIRLQPDANGGQFITDASGDQVMPKTTGLLPLE